MKKILIIGPAWVGDMVMAQSLFKLLKAREPEAFLQVAAPAWTLPVVSRMPEISAMSALPFAHGRLDLSARYELGKQFRAAQFTQAIVLPNSFKSALVPWWAKIPLRTGWSRELRSLIMNDTRTLDKKRYPLMVQRYLALGLRPEEALPSQYASPALSSTMATQTTTLEKLGLAFPKGPVLALCPGAEFGPSKRWPEEAYAEVAREKLAAGWQVWLFGSAKDKVVTERIQALTGGACLDLAGRTRLDEAIDLLALATAVITNDSGLMHVAAALQRPLLALYGSSSPQFTPPLADQVSIMKLDLPCQPCFKRECPLKHQRCLRDLKPASVLNALGELVSV
jgi:heptosyltransferase-2